jgi:DNA-binding transcriptional ArsR family regulator
MTDSRVSSQPVQLFRLPPHDRDQPSADHDCLVALRALGEDTRVRIIGLLIDAPLDVGEIARRVGVSQYNVSKHLRILREAGLLQVRKVGRRHLYALPDAIRQQAAEQAVVDLGCCSFKFGQAPTAARSDRSRKRPERQVARPSR